MHLAFELVNSEKKLQKCFFHHINKSKVSGVGYRGKMFYLLNLLLHVIGFS